MSETIPKYNPINLQKSTLEMTELEMIAKEGRREKRRKERELLKSSNIPINEDTNNDLKIKLQQQQEEEERKKRRRRKELEKLNAAVNLESKLDGSSEREKLMNSNTTSRSDLKMKILKLEAMLIEKQTENQNDKNNSNNNTQVTQQQNELQIQQLKEKQTQIQQENELLLRKVGELTRQISLLLLENAKKEMKIQEFNNYLKNNKEEANKLHDTVGELLKEKEELIEKCKGLQYSLDMAFGGTGIMSRIEEPASNSSVIISPGTLNKKLVGMNLKNKSGNIIEGGSGVNTMAWK